MYFLDFNICTQPEMDVVWKIIGIIVKAIWIGIPILLIIFGSIDLGKAVISSKDDEIKKSAKTFGRRFLAAVAVFATIWIVTLVLNLVSDLGLTSVNGNTVNEGDLNGWSACWCKISKGTDHEYKYVDKSNKACSGGLLDATKECQWKCLKK